MKTSDYIVEGEFIPKGTELEIIKEELLLEMANYQKRDTGLSVNVWIDMDKTYLKGGHFKRLKFQLNKANSIQKGNFASVSLADNKVISKDKILKQKNCEIRNAEMEEVENFATNNNFALCCLADNILTESEFLRNFIMGRELKSDSEITEAKLKTKEILQRNKKDNNYDSEQLILVDQALLR